jgi:hypothetical protein
MQFDDSSGANGKTDRTELHETPPSDPNRHHLPSNANSTRRTAFQPICARMDRLNHDVLPEFGQNASMRRGIPGGWREQR